MQADVKNAEKLARSLCALIQEDYNLQILTAKIDLHFITLLPKLDSIFIKQWSKYFSGYFWEEGFTLVKDQF